MGNATAADVLALVDLMRLRVREQFGAELAPEILFLGDWAPAVLTAASDKT